MRKLNTTGFSAVEGILIVVIVGIIGAVGWYVIKSRNNANQSLDNANNSQSNTVTSSKKVTTKKMEDNTKYLVIKEWGVKFKLSSGITDAIYTSSSMDPGFEFLSTQSLKGTGCDLDNTAGGGFYIRFKSGDMDSEAKQPYSAEYPDAIKLGQYYYGYGRNPAAEQCDKVNTVQQKADDAAKEFEAALKTIQEVN